VLRWGNKMGSFQSYNLIEKLKNKSPEKMKKLTNEERILLIDNPFETDSCLNCSHSVDVPGWWVLGCDSSGEVEPLEDRQEGAVYFSPEDALNYIRGFGDLCRAYDGPAIFTEKEVLEYVEKRNNLLKRLSNK